MKGICVDSTNSAVLEVSREYFLFPNGPNAYYVSKFDRETAHFGCFQAKRFEVLEMEEGPSEPNNKVPDDIVETEQLSLFEELWQEDEEEIRVLIPNDVISPTKSSSGPNSKGFKKIVNRWANYVRSIQKHHRCSWFEAMDLLEVHRDSGTPIAVEYDPGEE